jgi:DNA-directed RNA polymerase specialized sigma24 family protein
MITRTQMKRQQVILTAGYNSFEKGLGRYAVSRMNNRETTDDLVQNTFLKTWRYLVKGGKIDVMEAFLYHVLKALIVDEYRRHKTTSLDVLLEKGFEPITDETNRLADMLDGKQIAELIPQLPLLYARFVPQGNLTRYWSNEKYRCSTSA